MTIRVIGAGLGRTGTTSLKVALEQLGFGPCYHMTEAIQHPSHAKVWRKAWRGEAVQWPTFLQKYGSAVDFPACSFYPELMDAYPDAKVILTVRDPERWYDSAYQTIYLLLQAMPRWMRWLPWAGDIYRMTEEVVWQGSFEGRFENRARAIHLFERWNAEVQETVPAERLLVFDVKQGWQPLCAFLGVPIPPGPFPHKNDRQRMVRARQFLHLVRRGLTAATVISVALGILGSMRNGDRPSPRGK